MVYAMNNSRLPGIAVFLLCSAGWLGTAGATLNKWVDEKGTTHYDQIIPPEYAGQSSIQLNNKGRIEKFRTVESPAERQKNEAARSKQLADETAAYESKRRDNALLNTYTTEKEIDLARDRSLQQIELRLSSFTSLLKAAQSRKTELLKEQDNLAQLKRSAPQSLLDEIRENESRIIKIEKDITQSDQERVAVKKRFESDKLRFKELKQN